MSNIPNSLPCPTCNGTRTVTGGTYDDPVEVRCDECDGDGVIYGKLKEMGVCSMCGGKGKIKDFEESTNEDGEKVREKVKHKCRNCFGTGITHQLIITHTCGQCDGKGKWRGGEERWVKEGIFSSREVLRREKIVCTMCDGTGKFKTEHWIMSSERS